MSFPNSTITDIVAAAIESRSPEIADNVSNNNGLLARLKKKGKVKTVSGGRVIWQPFTFAQNGNGSWYSGYDLLPVGAADVISGAEFTWKQLAVPVTISGLEKIQTGGKEGIFDLMEERLSVAEATMMNMVSTGIYSDGTTYGGKTITGLDAAVPQDPTTGTYGGINRATSPANLFWRSQLYDPASTPTATTIQGYMNTLWASCVRGMDRPDLIMTGSTTWAIYMSSLQALQRFSDAESADLGFRTVKYMDADVVLDGGIGGAATATDMYFLNTNYLFFRPHVDTNFVALGKRRQAINQDADVEVLGWAGNLTCSGAQFQGRAKFD
jgi:hypothetical protein